MIDIGNKRMDITAFSEYRSLLMISAAFSIFLMHIICSNIYSFGTILDKLLVLYGSSGVDIFLFLSGMGIYCSLDNSYKISMKRVQWYKNRLLKVMIAYILIIVPFSILNKDSLPIALSRISTLYFWIFQNDGCWFVSFILLMYLVAPLIYQIIKMDEGRQTTGAAWILLIGVCIVLFAFERVSENLYLRLSIGLSRIPAFIIGMMIGSNLKNGRTRIPLRLLLFLATASIFELLLNMNEMAFTILVLKSCRSLLIMILEALVLTVVGLKAKRPLKRNAIAFLGSITLEFYLIHLLILNLIQRYNLTFLNDNILMVGLFLVATLILCYLVKNISNPLLKFLKG